MDEINYKLPEKYLQLLQRLEELEQKFSNTIHPEHGRSSHHDEYMVSQDSDLYTSKTPPVILSSKAFLRIAIHALKYAHPSQSQSKWVEVIGLLTGHLKNENTPLEQVVITDAWPVGHGDAVSVQIIDPTSVTKILEQLSPGTFICGWYHSHPSYGNFLSRDDFMTQQRYQRLWDKAIALVIDPTKISRKYFGFEIFRNVDDGGSYKRLDYKVDGLTPASAWEVYSLFTQMVENDYGDFLGT